MDTSEQFVFSTAVAEWLSHNVPSAAFDLSQDDAADLPQYAASDLPPGHDVDGVQSSNSGSSTATTFYDVYSDGPNLPNLPVEIFGMIVSQISRQDVRNLRVVSRQCEANASAYYFKDVVVPFRSQMLRSISPDRDGTLKNLSTSILSNGGRIFGEFGHLIRRFALSLELDEDTLEYPPHKPKQQVIRSYWGLYRWPHASYSRYQEVSGIENDADEFEHMRGALRCLSHVTELGLCSDVGLGFLSGPNLNARYNTIRHRVFQDQYDGKNKISLGSVVADWRRFHVSAPEYVDEVSVSPLDAVPLAHALIKDYISLESKIESLHFEWICGGELASGCHQRSQHILPAPFFASPEAMARPAMAKVGTDSELLRLPYVRNLSLKNCWVAPHVLLQSLRDYALCSLERVEFEGVSLSVMPWVTGDPPPPNLVDLGAGPTAANVIVNFSQWHSGLLLLQQPSWMSWTGLIEHFSPSAKVRDAIDRYKNATARARCAELRKDTLRQLTRIIPDARELFSEEALYELESLTFKSCGYVNLDHESFRIGSMIPSSELSLLSATLPALSEFTPFMQRCNKNLVGRIVNSEMLTDKIPFAKVFNFTMGWQGVYDSKIAEAAEADNCQRFGIGRFSGLLAKDVDVKLEKFAEWAPA
ncbi:hypothetical protein MY11210_000286 [Beauveria gryllotalpidicola]